MPNGTLEALAVLALYLALGALVLSTLTASWLGSPRKALRRIALGVLGVAGLSLIVVGGCALFLKNPNLIDVPMWYQVRSQIIGDRDLPVSLRLDSIAGLSLGVLGFLGLALSWMLPSLFASSNKPPRVLGASLSLLWLGAVLLCVADHSILLFVGWELWAFGLLLGVWGEGDATRRVLYTTQLGLLLLLVSVSIISAKTGDIGVSFREWRDDAPVRGVVGSIGFVWMLLSFSMLLGIAPFHRLCANINKHLPLPTASFLAGASPVVLFCVAIRLWAESGLSESSWGVVLLWYGSFGAAVVSFYALLERDPRQIASYTTSAAIGLCLAGLGAGASGVMTEATSLAAVGYTAALYYSLCAGLALGALRASVGLISSAVSGANIEELGGLHRTMPRTSLLAVLSGAAVAGLPPFGAFVGLWFLWQALFLAPRNIEKLAIIVGVVGVALATALLLFSLLRFLAVGILGVARSARATEASEQRAATRGGFLLVGFSLALGLIVGPTMGKLQLVIEGITGKFEVPMSAIAIELNKSRLAPLTLFIVVSVVGLLSFALARRGNARRRARSKAAAGETLPSGIHADALSQPLRHIFRRSAQISAARTADPDETPQSAKAYEYSWGYQDRLHRLITWRPSAQRLDWLLGLLQPKQAGAYLLWLALALLALLIGA